MKKLYKVKNMENEASYNKKMCDAKSFVMYFYIIICIQNINFHEKIIFILF